MAKAFGFTEDAAKRVAAAVRTVERTPPERRVTEAPTGGMLPIKIGKLDEALAAGGSATMSIWTFDGTTFEDSGQNIEVYDKTLDDSGSIASGSTIIAASNGRVWLMIDAKCQDIS